MEEYRLMVLTVVAGGACWWLSNIGDRIKKIEKTVNNVDTQLNRMENTITKTNSQLDHMISRDMFK